MGLLSDHIDEAARQSLQTMERATTLPVGWGNIRKNTGNSPFWTPCYFNGAELPMYTISSVPSNAYYINLVICCLVNALLTFSTIILNGLTVLAYWKSSQLKKKACYFLVMLLSSSDFVTGVCCNSLYTVYLAAETVGDHSGCYLIELLTPLTNVCCVASASILIVLNFERYLGICHVIFHQKHVTKPRCVMASLIVSFFIFVGLMAHFIAGAILGRLLYAIVVSAIFLTVTLMYVRIFNHNRQMVNPIGHVSQTRHARKMKFLKSCIMIIGASMMCFMPVTLYTVVKRQEFPVVVFGLWSITSFFANATVNSIIFFWKNRALRSVAIKILRQTPRKPLFSSAT